MNSPVNKIHRSIASATNVVGRRHRARTVLGVLTLMAMAASQTARAQAVWDGDTAANNDGNWNTGANWDTGIAPSAETATLGDVDGNGDSGTATRTVTIGANTPAITQLIMTQDAADFTNRLNMTGGTMQITSGTALVQNLTGGAIRIDMSGSAWLRATSGTTWNHAGTLTLAGTNVRIGPDGGDTGRNTTVQNAGTLNATGALATIGHMQGAGGTASRGDVSLNNNSGAAVHVADNATLVLRSRTRFRQNNPGDGNVYNAEGTTFQIGQTAGGASGGVLRFFHANSGDLQTAGESAVSVQRFRNAGVLDILGASVLELEENRSGGGGVFGVTRIFTVNNEASGVINLDGTSRIGRIGAGTAANQHIVTVFTNAGEFNKTGAGEAVVESFTSVTHSDSTTTEGLNANTVSGTINVAHPAGTLRLSVGLTNLGSLIGNGTLSVDDGAIVTEGGGSVRPGQSPGDTVTLALVANAVEFGADGTLRLDLDGADHDVLAVTGDLTLEPGSTLDLIGLPGGGRQVIVTYSGTRTGTFGDVNNVPANRIDYSVAGEIAMTPPPGSLFLMR